LFYKFNVTFEALDFIKHRLAKKLTYPELMKQFEQKYDKLQLLFSPEYLVVSSILLERLTTIIYIKGIGPSLINKR
jgi:ribosomal protein S4